MNKDISVSIKMAEIELHYAEAELANFGTLWTELQSTMEHIVAAKEMLMAIEACQSLASRQSDPQSLIAPLPAPDENRSLMRRWFSKRGVKA